MGNVTHKVPGLQSYVKVVPNIRPHTLEAEEAFGSPAAHHALAVSAKALAMSGVDILTEPLCIKRIREAFAEMKVKYA